MELRSPMRCDRVRQVAQQDSDRPAICDDMVCHEFQDVFLSIQTDDNTSQHQVT